MRRVLFDDAPPIKALLRKPDIVQDFRHPFVPGRLDEVLYALRYERPKATPGEVEP